jgi:type I restriction enzyme M protein
MAKRHEFRRGDWESLATRLDEIICAHSGEDPFEESLKLLVAKMAFEENGGISKDFLSGTAAEEASKTVNHLLGEASDRWRGILEPASECRLNGTELLRCADILRSGKLLGSDLVGLDTVFEFIVNKSAKGQKGQYFTPRHVVKAVAKMVPIEPNARVVDPACGSGAFLRAALVEEPSAAVYGFDIDARATRVARVLLVASGQLPRCIMRTDSLQRPKLKLFSEKSPAIEDFARTRDPKFRGFDVVLTNPPFAGDVGNEFENDYELARNRRVERDVLFLERCIELLRPGGRMAIVLPHNKVGGSQWAYVRKWLLENTRVTAVLGLGRNTFLPHTSQKASVVFLVKRCKRLRKIARHEKIVFYVSERDGKDRRGCLSYLDKETGVLDHDLSEATPAIRHAFEAASMEE